MNPLVTLDGVIGWVILAVPLAALALYAAAALWAASRRRKTEIDFDSRENRGAWTPAPESAEATRGGASDRGPASNEPTVRAVRVDLEAAIVEAEKAGDRVRLADLYLAIGIRERKAGNAPAAAELLRNSVMLANDAGQAAIHAKGRLELGDLAQEAGDLGTACEHWQMARALFEQVEQATQRAEVEARMHQNGCPTDWVLTDF